MRRRGLSVLRSFSSDSDPLLPGLISVHVHTVPTKSGKLRLVVDLSAGVFSPNSHISRHDIQNDLVSVHHVAHNLLLFHATHGRSRAVVLQVGALASVPTSPDASCLANAGSHHRERQAACRPVQQLWRARVCHDLVRVHGTSFSVSRSSISPLRRTSHIWMTISATAIICHDDSAELVWYAPYQSDFPRKQGFLLLLSARACHHLA
jgi:hypothetical protein